MTPWRKASASNSQGNCLELRTIPWGMVMVRHSQAPVFPKLVFTRADWAAFLRRLKTAMAETGPCACTECGCTATAVKGKKCGACAIGLHKD